LWVIAQKKLVMIDKKTIALTVIIPCYNEELSLPQFMPDVIRFCKERNWPLICVNDGSNDSTLEVLLSFGNDILVVNNKVNKGYGGAIKSGINKSETFYSITIDADGQHFLEDVERLYARCVEKDADMVIGSRKGLKSATWFRNFGKSIIRMVAKILMPINIYDINSGMKLFRTDLAKQYIGFLPDTMAFSDTIALVFINQRHRVIEEPIKIKERIAGVSTIGIHTAFVTITELLNIVTLFNPMKIFLPIATALFSIGLVWGLWIFAQGRGLSVGASFLMIMGLLIFLLGLLSEQITRIRRHLININNKV
jgi:glycosyltransferase involved in cell wall biosynthesis